MDLARLGCSKIILLARWRTILTLHLVEGCTQHLEVSG